VVQARRHLRLQSSSQLSTGGRADTGAIPELVQLKEKDTGGANDPEKRVRGTLKTAEHGSAVSRDIRTRATRTTHEGVETLEANVLE